jgi:hypothetical protein
MVFQAITNFMNFSIPQMRYKVKSVN